MTFLFNKKRVIMRKNKTYLLLALSCLLMWSCSKDAEPKIIEAELQVHFDAFVTEAASHNIEIDLSTIDLGGYVKNIETDGTMGQCISYTDGSKNVVVDEQIWDRLDALEREYVVFHELGHCILQRSHNDEQDTNGVCESIMQSGDRLCQSNYTITNRSILLNELFTN